MSRNTSQRIIGNIAAARVKPGIYHGRLAEEYDGIGQYVLVSLSMASVSSAYKARVASGDFGTGVRFPTGTPVSLSVYRGKIEILSLGSKGFARVSSGSGTSADAPFYEDSGFGESGTGGGTLIIPAGLTNSALIFAVANEAGASPITWTVGAVVQNAVNYGSQIDANGGEIALWIIMNPTPGSGAFLADGSWVGFWLLQNVHQTDPIYEVDFSGGTSFSTAAGVANPAGTTVLDSAQVFEQNHSDTTVAAVPAGSGQITDWIEKFDHGGPSYTDRHSVGSHGSPSPVWNFDRAYSWSAFAVAIKGADFEQTTTGMLVEVVAPVDAELGELNSFVRADAKIPHTLIHDANDIPTLANHADRIADLEAAGPGGAGASWVQLVDQSGASIAAWTALDGTWASDGTNINQTEVSANPRELRYDTILPFGWGVIAECEMRFPTAGQGSGANVQAKLALGRNAAQDSGALAITLEYGSVGQGLELDRDAEFVFTKAPLTIALDTWYKVRVMTSGIWATAWLDGTLLRSAAIGSVHRAPADHLMLITYNALVNFRNIKMWTLSGGAPA